MEKRFLIVDEGIIQLGMFNGFYVVHEHFKKPFNMSFHSFIRIW